MSQNARIVSNVLGLIGGALGATLGYFAFFWITRYGFYAMIVPGGLLGLGCGLLARHSSNPRGLVCGLTAVFLGLFTEWKFRPFNADESFSYLLTHVHQLTPVTLLMIGAGGLVAYWTGKEGDIGGLWRLQKAAPPPPS